MQQCWHFAAVLPNLFARLQLRVALKMFELIGSRELAFWVELCGLSLEFHSEIHLRKWEILPELLQLGLRTKEMSNSAELEVLDKVLDV